MIAAGRSRCRWRVGQRELRATQPDQGLALARFIIDFAGGIEGQLEDAQGLAGVAGAGEDLSGEPVGADFCLAIADLAREQQPVAGGIEGAFVIAGLEQASRQVQLRQNLPLLIGDAALRLECLLEVFDGFTVATQFQVRRADMLQGFGLRPDSAQVAFYRQVLELVFEAGGMIALAGVQLRDGFQVRGLVGATTEAGVNTHGFQELLDGLGRMAQGHIGPGQVVQAQGEVRQVTHLLENHAGPGDAFERQIVGRHVVQTFASDPQTANITRPIRDTGRERLGLLAEFQGRAWVLFDQGSSLSVQGLNAGLGRL